MPENSGENREYSGERDSWKNIPIQKEKPEIQDTREDFITFFNTFNKNLIKME